MRDLVIASLGVALLTFVGSPTLAASMSKSDMAMMKRCQSMSESDMKKNKGCMAMMKKHPDMMSGEGSMGNGSMGNGSMGGGSMKGGGMSK